MIRLAGTRASRAVRSTTRCHSASVSGGISGSTVVTAAVPMTKAAGPGPIGDGDASLPAYALGPRPGHRGMPCRRTIEGHLGRIPESIWGTAPYCSGRGGSLSRGPGTARPGPTGRAVAAGAAHVRRWDGRLRGTFVPGLRGAVPGSRARRRAPGGRPSGLRRPGAHCSSGRRPRQSGPWWSASELSSSMASCNDVRMRSNASWPLMAMSSFSHKNVN